MKPRNLGQLLADPAEQQRLLALDHGPEIFRQWSVIEDGERVDYCAIRSLPFNERLAEWVDALPTSTGEPLDKATNGENVGHASDHMFGSREPAYIDYCRKALPYGGAVDSMLSNGHHCHIDRDGLVWRTSDPDAVEELFATYADNGGQRIQNYARRNTAAIERMKLVSATRVPDVKERLEDHAETVKVAVEAGVRSTLKALEKPKKRAGK